MPIPVPVDDYDVENPFGGGSYLEDPGVYHCQVVDWQDVEDGHPDYSGYEYTELKFEVLAGPNAGKTSKERFNWYGKDELKTASLQKRLTGVALRLRMLSEADIDAARKKGEAIQLDFSQAVGCQAIVEFETREYEAKDGTKKKALKVPWGGIYDVDDPDWAHVDRNEEVAKLGGKQAGQAGKGGRPAAAKNAAKKVESVEDELDGI